MIFPIQRVPLFWPGENKRSNDTEPGDQNLTLYKIIPRKYRPFWKNMHSKINTFRF